MSIVIVGGKAGAKIAAEIFSLQGIKNILFAETYWEEKKETQLTDDYKQVPQIIKDNDYAYFIATGDNNLRSEIYQFIFEHTGKQPINCIHPSAVISPSATLGFGNLICPLAVLHTESSIGNCAIINTGSIVEHDCVVKNFAQITSAFNAERIPPINTLNGKLTIITNGKCTTLYTILGIVVNNNIRKIIRIP